MNKQLLKAGVKPIESPYHVEAEIYRVRDYCKDSGAWSAFGLNEADETDRADWYEYRVELCYTRNASVVDAWDSLHESWNGMQFLTKAECERAVAEIKDDVRQGKVTTWFSNGKDFGPQAAPLRKKPVDFFEC